MQPGMGGGGARVKAGPQELQVSVRERRVGQTGVGGGEGASARAEVEAVEAGD